jgi:hypothetical protein
VSWWFDDTRPWLRDRQNVGSNQSPLRARARDILPGHHFDTRGKLPIGERSCKTITPRAPLGLRAVVPSYPSVIQG